MHKSSLPSIAPFLCMIEGEGGTEGGAPPAQPPANGAPPAPEGGGTGQTGPPPQGGTQPPEQQPPAAEDVASLPDWAQKVIRDARADAGKARTDAKATAAQEATAELAQTIGKALGLVQDDAPADPAKLTEQLTAREAELSRERVENAAYRAAVEGGAVPARLLDSRSFLEKAHQLDPAAADFAAQLDAAVKAAVEADPTLRAAGQVPRRSPGGQFTGGAAPAGGQQRPTSLRAAFGARN